eukprot:14163361-Alexandrium_andersonii.AAC.1
MVHHFAQAPEFCCNRVRDGDVITSACYVSVLIKLGSYVDIQPPAGYYISLASGPTLNEDLPTEEPTPEPWKPVE